MRDARSIGPLVLVLAVALPAQSARDVKIADYHKQVTRHHADAAQGYIDIATWARKVGLVPQSTTLFLRAKAVSQGKHPAADQLVSLMQTYGDAFWRKKHQKPVRALVSDCDRRVRTADERTRRSHVRIAQLALGIENETDAREHCRAAMALGAEVTVDADGNYKLDRLSLPEEFAAILKSETVADNKGRRRFEPAAAGGAALQLDGFHSHEDEKLLVRTDLGSERAQKLHELGSALLPHIENRIDGAPSRQLVLLVFAKRVGYDDYLRARKLENHAAGLADYGGFQTLVCAEGKGDDELHALVLHELSHLFFWGTAPAVLPDWYAEGFAESFGGQGTFAYDGKTLAVGGPMAEHRLLALKQSPIAIRDLLALDAHSLWHDEPEKALRSYTAAWAFQRMLLRDGSKWREDFLAWERQCRSAVLGAVVFSPMGLAGAPRPGSAAAATQKFEVLFGKHLDAIDKEFQAYVQGL
jgi:hypothetical protein